MSLRPSLLPAFLGMAVLTSAQDPVIQGIIDDVRIDSMMAWVNELSGEVPITIDGTEHTLLSRHKNNAGNALAQSYLMQKFAEFGYDPIEYSFSATGKNILVYKPGDGSTNEMVVICGHYDATSSDLSHAPAADDDGSGTCAVLEAARVLRDVSFVRPILFALWDEEEQGKVGSNYYAADASGDDSAFFAVVNMDAIAWDGDGDTQARVHSRPIANSPAIADTVFAVQARYNIDLDLILTNPGATYSDHASFWTNNIGAVLIIEDFSNDPNPYYHTPNDRVQHFDVGYYEKLAKLSIASTATLAIPVGTNTVVEDLGLPEVNVNAYPNPTSMDASLWVELPSVRETRITVHEAIGREVMVLHDGMLPSGRKRFDLPLSSLPAGGYVVRMQVTGMLPVCTKLVRLP